MTVEAPQHPRKHEMHLAQVKKKKRAVLSRVKWFWFICACVSDVVSYKRNVAYSLSCLLQTYKLFVSWQFFETYGVVNYGSGWRKDAVNQCLEFGSESKYSKERLAGTGSGVFKMTDFQK